MRGFSPCQGKAPDERGDVLDRVKTSSNADDDRIFRPVESQGLQKLSAIQGRDNGGEVQPIVDGEQLLRIKASLDKHVTVASDTPMW